LNFALELTLILDKSTPAEKVAFEPAVLVKVPWTYLLQFASAFHAGYRIVEDWAFRE
jgi:hypothetical protein